MSRNSRLVWIFIFILTLADAIWLKTQDMSVAPRALKLIFLPILPMLALAVFYTRVRPDRRLASLAHMTAVVLAFMSASCIMSYLTGTLQAPLIDRWLVATDRAMGLDWLSMYHWIAAKPVLKKIMTVIYMSLIPQIVVLLITLNLRGQIARAWEGMWLFMLACMGCIFFSGIWPAVGAFGYFHVELTEPYLREMASLRDGTLKVIGGRGTMQGVVEFPSLHMALAILYPYAMRGIPILFPVFLVLDALVIATTPMIGGHHFADLWGGAAVALACIWIVRQPFFVRLLADQTPGKARKTKDKKIRGRSR